MSTPIAPDPDETPLVAAATDQPVAAPAAAEATGHPDPITGEPGAHPVGVGVGALSAGVAGAAIGAIGGPIGVLIGAAIGAVAGGLAGKEVATTSEAPVVATDAGDATTAGEPPLTLPADAPTPITMGSVPGEGFRAVAGSGFANDATFSSTGDPSLPVPVFAPIVHEDAPLMGTPVPVGGEEAVRVAAYYRYLDRIRAGEPGDAVGDWLEAESEVLPG